MDRRWGRLEVPLHVSLGRRTPVHLGVVVDEREVLPLFTREAHFCCSRTSRVSGAREPVHCTVLILVEAPSSGATVVHYRGSNSVREEEASMGLHAKQHRY